MPLQKYHFKDENGHYLEGCLEYQSILAERDELKGKLVAAEEALRAADEIVGVIQFPDSNAELLEILRNRVCLLRHGMCCPDSIGAANNAMNAFSELSEAIFSCGIGAREKAIKNYVGKRAALAGHVPATSQLNQSENTPPPASLPGSV